MRKRSRTRFPCKVPDDSFGFAASRKKLSRILSKIGFTSDYGLVDELWKYTPISLERRLIPLRLWIAVSVAAYLSPIFLGITGLMFIIIPISILNIYIHQKMKYSIGAHTPSIFYLLQLIGGAGAILRAGKGADVPDMERLAHCHGRVKSFRKSAGFLQPTGASMTGDVFGLIFDYIKIFLLGELHAFVSIYHRIGRYLPEIKELFMIIGGLDAALSLLDYEEKHEDEICCCRCSDTSHGVYFEELVHPLVEDCVSNSLSLGRGVILTGTNMSGKSTFLRTLGANQVLATTFGFAYARSFETGFYAVLTSISTVDDLFSKTSKYFAEAQRLLSVLRRVMGKEERYLVLVDEILSGTNSDDRIRASISILENLAHGKSLVIAATHDLAIAHGLESSYGNYHFSETIGKDSLDFDYRIKPGIVDARNALRILRYPGYPEEILSVL